MFARGDDAITKFVYGWVLWALECNNDHVSYCAAEFLSALIHPMHDGFEYIKEQANKRMILMNAGA